MLDYNVIGRKIKEERVNKNISQVELANKLGVSTGYISQIESGQKCFNLKRFEQVAKILEKPTSYFIEASDEDEEGIIREIVSDLKLMNPEKLDMVRDIIASVKNSD